MTENPNNPAMKEMMHAINRGMARRRDATVQAAPGIVKETIKRQLGFQHQRQDTHEDDLALQSLAAGMASKMRQELGGDHPLTCEWNNVLRIVSGRLENKSTDVDASEVGMPPPYTRPL